jgi:hypothetical protein
VHVDGPERDIARAQDTGEGSLALDEGPARRSSPSTARMSKTKTWTGGPAGERWMA